MSFNQAPNPSPSTPPTRRRTRPWLVVVIVALLLLCGCCVSAIVVWQVGDNAVAVLCQSERATVEDLFGAGTCARLGVP